VKYTLVRDSRRVLRLSPITSKLLDAGKEDVIKAHKPHEFGVGENIGADQDDAKTAVGAHSLPVSLMGTLRQSVNCSTITRRTSSRLASSTRYIR
jgi:hypothetical protein